MRLRGGALLLIVALWPAMAQAQRRAPPSPRPPEPKPVREVGELKKRFGPQAAAPLLASRDDDARVRAVQRLLSIGTPQANDMLLRAIEPGGPLSRDLRARLEAVRGLASRLGGDQARQAVLRALVDGAALSGPGEALALAAVLRDTAALSLARDGSVASLDALFGLVRQGGAAGEASLRALAAYPPRTVAALVDAGAPIALGAIELIRETGDLRGVGYLRRAVREGDARARAAALFALASLGDGEAAPIAKSWAPVPDVMARVAAARALLLVSPAEGRALVASLLDDEATRDEALELALSSPGEALLPPLERVAAAPGAVAGQRASALAAIGRAGGARAAALLAGLLDRPAAHEAAQALALSPGPHAREAIERALGAPATRAIALRAGAVRTLALDDAPSGLARAAREALSSTDAALQAAGAFVLLLRGELPGGATTNHAASLGRALLSAGGARQKLVDAALDALSRGADGAARSALAAALVHEPLGGAIDAASLAAWAEGAGPEAPLAARALAARDLPAYRPVVVALVASSDVQLRAHTLAGLGLSAEPDAAGMLERAYAFEPEPEVRRAIIRALARRTEPPRARVLALASSLDPDAEARSLARAALRGRAIAPLRPGSLVAFLASPRSSPPQTYRFARPDGVVVPVVPDPDGAMLVPGLPPGGSHVTLAPPSQPPDTAP